MKKNLFLLLALSFLLSRCGSGGKKSGEKDTVTVSTPDTMIAKVDTTKKPKVKFVDYTAMPDNTYAENMIKRFQQDATVIRTFSTMTQMISFDPATLNDLMGKHPHLVRIRFFAAAYPAGHVWAKKITMLVQFKEDDQAGGFNYTYYDLRSEQETAFDCLCPPPNNCDVISKIN